MSINAVNYGADPTGAKDSTAAIQRAVDDVASHGGGSVELPRGIYRVSYPFIEIKHRVEVIGQGPATVVIAHSDRAIPATSDGYIEYTGVFHVGSYTTPVYGAYNANKPMRMGVRNLHIRTNAANTPIDSYPLDAHTTPLDHVAGVIMHTHFTGDQLNEPDVVPVIAGVEVWDTAIGVAVLGLDDQGMKIDDVTVRRTLNQGLLLGKPVGHRRRGTEGLNSGAADNKLRGVDVAEANLSGGSYAGIEVYAAQSKFENCSSNSNHRTLGKSALYEPGTRNAGAGWIVQGERNMFIGCTARSNAGHGWLVEWRVRRPAGPEPSAVPPAPTRRPTGTSAAMPAVPAWSLPSPITRPSRPPRCTATTSKTRFTTCALPTALRRTSGSATAICWVAAST